MTAPLLVTSSAAACGVVTSTTPDKKEPGYSPHKYSWGLKSCVSNATCAVINRVNMTDDPSTGSFLGRVTKMHTRAHRSVALVV
jgi:hypothetical protein